MSRRSGSWARVRRCPSTPACPASLAVLAVLVLALGGSACEPALPADSSTPVTGPILGGTVDTTTEAVMALVQQSGTPAMPNSSACTGTTIAKVGGFGILLTAAHCVVANDGKGRVTIPLKLATPNQLYVLPGANWQDSANASAYFGVAAVAIHPDYNGAVDSPVDVAVVRYLGATAATQVIPALAPGLDTLAVNSKITLVGYGKTETDAMNSQRRRVDRTIASIAARQFSYDQTDIKGACEGDSGGPALFQAASGLRVAGVTSFGDATCRRAGISVRVSSADAFIQQFVTATPATLSCEDCTIASVAPGNTCFALGASCAMPSTPCGAYLTCLAQCQTTTCATQCRNTMSAGATAYTNLAKCQCGGTCETPCRQDQACTSFAPPPPTVCGGLTDNRPACLSCITNSCCSQATACTSDPTCASCLRTAGTECRINLTYNALNTCLGSCQGAPCSTPTTPRPDAGTTAAPDSGTATPDPAGPQPPGVAADMDAGCACASSPSKGGVPRGDASAFGALGMVALLFFRRRAR